MSKEKPYCSSAQLWFMYHLLKYKRPPRRYDWRSASRLTAAKCCEFRYVKIAGLDGGEYVVLPEGIRQLELAGMMPVD